MHKYCIGDLHGSYDKLMQVLENSKFSDDDILYSLGDFCDRGTHNYETLKFIMSLGDRFKPIIGNHDWWLYLWLESHLDPNYKYTLDESDSLSCWISYNGGRNTHKELKDKDQEWLTKLYEWLKPIPFIRKEDNKVIIHSIGPKNEYECRKPTIPLEEITLSNIRQSGLMKDIVYDSRLWNRQVIQACNGYMPIGQHYKSFYDDAKRFYGEDFNEGLIYVIGHTPLAKPFYDKSVGIIGIDTGAFCDTKTGWDFDGSLTLLDLDELTYYTSSDKEKHTFEDYKIN